MGNRNANQKIDFVVLWVDGNDPTWLKKKQRYKPSRVNDDGNNRYRDWGLFKYWFRGVEKFAPWVNRVYLVTDHQIPSWLNMYNKKLKIVYHEDYIDKKYLPLFNSNAIECCIDKIQGLSEHFVLFNDDMFLINYVKPKDFFHKDLPRDIYIENPIVPSGEDKIFTRTMITATEIVNSSSDKTALFLKHPLKVFNPIYGTANLRTLLTLPSRKFEGFRNPHVAQPLLKSNFEKVRSRNKEIFTRTLENRFRSADDITQFSVRYEHLASGNFIPRANRFSKYYEIKNDTLQSISNHIESKKSHIICINDCNHVIDIEAAKKVLQKSFDSILGDVSQFEKGAQK